MSKKIKVSAVAATTRGDDTGPLFVGESGVPTVPAITKEKSTQTTQQNVGYLGTAILRSVTYGTNR